MGFHGLTADFCGFLTGRARDVLGLFWDSLPVDKSVVSESQSGANRRRRTGRQHQMLRDLPAILYRRDFIAPQVISRDRN